MLMCTSVSYFLEWGVVVFEFYVPSFWRQSFRFAQTDGTRTGKKVFLLSFSFSFQFIIHSHYLQMSSLAVLEDSYTLTLAVEVPFLLLSTLVVALTIFLDIHRGSKDSLLSFETLQSSRAWLYLLYIVAVLVTFLRLILRHLDGGSPVPAEIVTIVYNWATTLMIAVSSIIPRRLSLNLRKAVRIETKSLKAVLSLVVFWVLLLLVTIVALAITQDEYWFVILTVWRVFFMTCAASEIAILAFVIFHLKRQNLKTTKTLVSYVFTTVGMRLGIVTTLILKFFMLETFDTFALKIAHMLLIMFGLSCYCYSIYGREVERQRKRSIVQTSYASTTKQHATMSINSTTTADPESGSVAVSEAS